jgi:hypothetical protein
MPIKKVKVRYLKFDVALPNDEKCITKYCIIKAVVKALLTLDVSDVSATPPTLRVGKLMSAKECKVYFDGVESEYYPISSWKSSIIDGHSHLGYWDWVAWGVHYTVSDTVTFITCEKKWGTEHPNYTKALWRNDVAHTGTTLGYWYWVAVMINSRDSMVTSPIKVSYVKRAWPLGHPDFPTKIWEHRILNAKYKESYWYWLARKINARDDSLLIAEDKDYPRAVWASASSASKCCYREWVAYMKARKASGVPQ